MKIKVLVSGASGVIGHLLVHAITAEKDLVLAGQANREAFFEADVPADVIVDFSHPELLAQTLDYALTRGLPLVTGTTGLDADLQARIEAASAQIPVCQAANFSLGVNLLAHLAAEAAQVLGPEVDVEIVEAHHRRKLDAPSGTALWLGQSVAQARGQVLEEVMVHDRSARRQPRPPTEIGFHALRGGTVVGDHSVIFFSNGERLELVHRSEDRSLYAQGALQAARRIIGRSPGRVEFSELLFGPAEKGANDLTK